MDSRVCVRNGLIAKIPDNTCRRVRRVKLDDCSRKGDERAGRDFRRPRSFGTQVQFKRRTQSPGGKAGNSRERNWSPGQRVEPCDQSILDLRKWEALLSYERA